MDPKSTVVKSKSSNSGISLKNKIKDKRKTQSNKKTRSSADFPHDGLKKRGVYVEKRLTKGHLANGKLDGSIPKRPRPGQKQFLNSVLTILSQSTTGTQYPEIEDTTECNYEKHNKNLKSDKRNNKINDSNDIKEVGNREKFKSKILNKRSLKEDKKKMVVLQSKKEIAQTPSNYSEWSCRNGSQKSNPSNCLLNTDSSKVNVAGSNVSDDLRNAIWEGRNVKKTKKIRYLEDEPKTLVSDADDKKLYNFFVDLLEKSISVYNVEAKYDAAEPSEASKTELQINESVANKLNVTKFKDSVEKLKSPDEAFNPQYLQYLQSALYNENNVPNVKAAPITIQTSRQDRFKNSKLKKMKAASFDASNKVKTVVEKSKSLEMNRRKTFRNKNDLINDLKQQLEFNNDFEEPQSIFQALRVMARNKRKKISFEPNILTDECVLKRRKVIPTWRNRKPKNKRDKLKNESRKDKIAIPKRKYSKYNFSDVSKKINKRVEIESSHSLEVYGYDYECEQTMSVTKKNKYITLNYHSSNSELDFDVSDAILNPTSENSSVRKF